MEVGKPAAIAYRPDVDGLRAVAVLSIVLFHAGVESIGGGFVGVDVFYVISGYLIGSIILKEHRRGTFSLKAFYERRIRRILPALLFMMFGVTILELLYHTPKEVSDYGKTLLAAVLSMSNLYFWRNTSYFAPEAETQPLLHTWSLGVEEQFYLLFPMSLILVWRIAPHRLREATLAVAILSFILSAAMVVVLGRFNYAAFYLLPTRGWELLLGFMVALDMFPRLTATAVRTCAATFGLILIVVACFGFTQRTPFPGAAALLPCFGTALIIAAGQSGDTLINRFLSLPPLVFVGQISYSLYLWHWPLVVFQLEDSLLVSDASPVGQTIAILAGSLIMAVLSWRFVECPFRSGSPGFPKPRLLPIGIGFLLIGSLGAATIATAGFPSRYPPEARRIASYLDYNAQVPWRSGSCFISVRYTNRKFDSANCLMPSANGKNYLLFGDSHAAQFSSGLTAALPHTRIMQATATGCHPLLDALPDSRLECRKLVDRIYSNFLVKTRVDLVILAARWEPANLGQLARTLEWFRAHQIDVVLLGPIVQYDQAVPRLLANQKRTGDAYALDRHRLRSLAVLDRRMARVARAHGAKYISLWRLMCAQPDCLATKDGTPQQFDYGHVTADGSLTLARLLIKSGMLS